MKGKRADLMVWCDNCETFFVIPEDRFDWTCPKCGEFTKRMKCTRCGHEWRPRSYTELPNVCPAPKCKSSYWNRARMKEMR